LYSLTAKFCSRCFTKQAYYADYNIRFLAIWVFLFLFSVLLSISS
jgi:hypothetical protein